MSSENDPRMLKTDWWVLIALLSLAATLRVWTFPAANEARDIDEGGYVLSSLLVLEGLPPAFKAAPGGVQIWLGVAHTAFRAAEHLVYPTASEASAPKMLRPVLALDRALFEAYRDGTGLRRFELACIHVVSLAGVAAGYQLGRKGGRLGSVLVGGMIAALPVFVSFSNMARPYSMAWYFAILAMNSASRRAPAGRFVAAAVWMGLSMSCRVEMCALLPLVAVEFLRAQKSQ